MVTAKLTNLLVCVALISGSNWNLKRWFLWREENRRIRRKTLRAGTRTNNKLTTCDAGSGNGTQATAVGGQCSHTAPCLHPQYVYTYYSSKFVLNDALWDSSLKELKLNFEMYSCWEVNAIFFFPRVSRWHICINGKFDNRKLGKNGKTHRQQKWN